MKINNSPLFSMFEEFQKSQLKLAEHITQSYSGINSLLAKHMTQSFDRLAEHMTQSFDRLISELNEGLKTFWTKLDNNFVDALEKAHGTPEKAKLIAELGWVIPSHATLTEYAAIIAPISDIKSADEAFTNYYLSDNAIELKGLKTDLLKCSDIKTWQPALEEAFLNLDEGRNMSCIALLLPLIDGVTSIKFSEPNFYKLNNRKAFFREKLRMAETRLIKYLWQSYEAFADNFFKSCQSSPSFLNRNWLLHGRDIPSSNLSDCLRLLQALETITYLH